MSDETKKPITGGPAFSNPGGVTQQLYGRRGMTIRDYFAIRIMSSLLASGEHDDLTFGEFAQDSILAADELIQRLGYTDDEGGS